MVMTLMICPAVCGAHDARVPARCGLLGCHSKLGRIGKVTTTAIPWQRSR
jgi:hypothetical protein